MDQNDNPPIFGIIPPGEVFELSSVGKSIYFWSNPFCLFSTFYLTDYISYLDSHSTYSFVYTIRVHVSTGHRRSFCVGVRLLTPWYLSTGTDIMTITATDADEEENENSQIAYSIVKQEPAGEDMFQISGDGVLSVRNANLDREVMDT